MGLRRITATWPGTVGGALAAIGFAVAAPAAGADELASEMDFFRPIAVVSSATRLTNSVLDTPASVTVIDRKLIAMSTATTIPDLLRLVPGFQVGMATGNLYTATYHGVSDQLERRLEVMVNGQSVYLATNASVDWNLLGVALEDIERIEVVRSPNAPTYGSNAIFGSINIVTRQPFALRGKYLRLTGGSIDTASGVVRLGGRAGPFDAVATLQYTEDTGFARVDDDKQVTNLRVHATRQLGLHDVLDIELGLSGGEIGADGVGSFLEPFRDNRLRDNYQKMEWRRSDSVDTGYRAAFYHRYTSQDDSYRVYLAPDLYAPLGFAYGSAERYDLELEQRLVPATNWRLLWGGAARYTVAKSDLYFARTGGKVSEWTGRVFVNAEWRPHAAWLFNFGALTDFHEAADTYTSPRIAVNWRFARMQALRASISRNYRVFSAPEQLADYPVVLSDGTYVRHLIRTDGPGLAPERLTSYELGYHAESPGAGLSFDFKLYYEDMRDKSSGARDPDRVTVWSDKGGDWNTRGGELQLTVRPRPDTVVLASYAYAETDGEEFTQIDADGNPLVWRSLDDTTPRHTLALQVSHEFTPAWSGTLAAFHVSDMRWQGEGGPVDGYTRLDLKVARQFKVDRTQGELALIVQNLTDDPYFEFRPDDVYEKSGNVFERRTFLQLRLQAP